MSLITKCDGDDCFKCDHSHDEEFYTTSNKAEELLRDVFENHGISHLCKDCIDSYNEDEEYLFVHDDWVYTEEEYKKETEKTNQYDKVEQ